MVAAEPVPDVSADAELAAKMETYVKERGGAKVIRRILIANNGMAATKTIMSIRNWAYNTFGVPAPLSHALRDAWRQQWFNIRHNLSNPAHSCRF